MSTTDAEYARIRAEVGKWMDRVARGEKVLPYGFDVNKQDIRHKQAEAEGKRQCDEGKT